MRESCNGCRVLRKGCSEKNCTIRPCLEWIKTPQSQANATLFLAKFYGRAGLQNLINAGPDPLRPAIFRSLLYEACGRIVNPIYGSPGLLWSGNWHLCHAAVEAVLAGAPIAQISSDAAVSAMSPPLKSCDIRHVSKDEISGASRDLRKVRTRGRFKRTGVKPMAGVEPAVDEAAQVIWSWSNEREAVESVSHCSVVSQREERPSHGGDGDSVSVEAVEATADEQADGSDVELELTLGFEPCVKGERVVEAKKGKEEIDGSEEATCEVHLCLNCSA